MIDARRAEIDKQYAEAHMAEAKAKKSSRHHVERGGIAAEREAVLKAAAAQAEEAAKARRAQAEREAAALLDGARKTLAAEREQVSPRQGDCLDLGAGIAARLLAEVPAKVRAEAWLESIEEYLAALPQTEREALQSSSPMARRSPW